LDVEHDGARLILESKGFFRAGDEVEILFAGQLALALIGIEGKGIEVFAAIRGLRLGLPFRERAGEIPCYGAAHIGDFDAVIVEIVHQVRGELLPAAALIAFGNHPSPPLAAIASWGIMPDHRIPRLKNGYCGIPGCVITPVSCVMAETPATDCGYRTSRSAGGGSGARGGRACSGRFPAGWPVAEVRRKRCA